MTKKITLLLILIFTSISIPTFAEDLAPIENEVTPGINSGQPYRGYNAAPSTPRAPILNNNSNLPPKTFTPNPPSTTRYDARCQFGACLGAPSNGGVKNNNKEW